MNPEWFAGRLRELRKAAGLTQAQLAEQAGLTREGIAQLEVGRNEPAWRTVLALAGALGVECNAFQQEPADRPAAAPGRPRKAAEGERPAPAKGKTPKKRKRKGG